MKIKLLILATILTTFACTKKLEEADVLYRKSLEATYKGNFETARSYLEKIDENYPYTEYAKNASMLLIYVNYKLQNYSELIPMVDFYIKTNPKDEAISYILYIKALSFYNQIKSYEKDKEILYEFTDIAKKMESNFPKAEFTKDLTIKNEFVKKTIIAGEINIALQYQQQGNCPAAISRYIGIIGFIEENDNKTLVQTNMEKCLKIIGLKN